MDVNIPDLIKAAVPESEGKNVRILSSNGPDHRDPGFLSKDFPHSPPKLYLTAEEDEFDPVTIADSTLVTVDGRPDLQAVPIQNVSVGQQIDMEAVATATNCGTVQATGDATGGLIRAWMSCANPCEGSSGVGPLPRKSRNSFPSG